MRTLVVLIAVVAAQAGCSHTEEACDSSDHVIFPRPCQDALIVALRDTETLTATSAEIDHAYRAIERGRTVSCELQSAYAIYDYSSDYYRPTVLSTYAPIVDAWSAGQVRTGLQEVDALFADRGAVEVAVAGEDRFTVLFEQPISHKVLAQEMTSVPDTAVDLGDYIGNPNNIERGISGDDVTITYVIGWGDCFSGCPSHEWRIRLGPSGDELLSEEGDEVPADVRDALCAGS